MMTLLAFIVTLAILVAVHEYGHFQMARWCGVKVLKFSLGFGKTLYSKKLGQDQTEFVVSALPLGGFVKMLDEREFSDDEPHSYDEVALARAFNRQSVWKRMAIVIAGPAANLLLAIALYWILMMQGLTGIKPELGEIGSATPAAQAGLHTGDIIRRVANEPVTTWQDVQWIVLEHVVKNPSIDIQVANKDLLLTNHHLLLNSLNTEDLEKDFLSKLGLNPKQPKVRPVIGSVLSGSPAEQSGIQVGDTIKALNGVAIDDWESLVKIIKSSPATPLKIELLRGNQVLTKQVTPKKIKENGEEKGQIGAGVLIDEKSFADALVLTHYSPSQALLMATKKTWETSIFSLKMIGNMLLGQVSIKSISGPVTIAGYAGQSAHMGYKAFIGFLAMVSISLGVLNLLPIPVLDGGHLLYYTVELVKGSPVSDKAMEMGQRIGMAIIAFLMICALYNDINRLIAG
jgi:regulator of sigma E protease